MSVNTWRSGPDICSLICAPDPTPLIFAAQYGHEEIVTILLNHGADIKIVTGDKLTALDFAKRNNHEQIVKYLTSLDFRINDTSK